MIPYAAIGTGIAVLLGIWTFVVAETAKARLAIAGAAAAAFLAAAILPPAVGFLGWILYGLGCIIYLRFMGLEIR